MLNNSIKVSRKRKHNAIWPAILVLIVAVLLAFVISGLWQVAEGKPFFPPQSALLPKPTSSTSSLASLVEEEKKNQDDKASSLENASDASKGKEQTPPTPVFEGVVPKAQAVDQSYFADAVFVGDSITEGMTIYSGMENATILAGTGINFSTIYTSAVIKNMENGARTTIMDELPKKQYAKVYVMLGGNEVRDMEKEAFLQRYEKVLDDIRKMQPGATLYVQSMTPVTASNNYKMSNPRIDEFNEGILAMCKRKNIYYLNVAECMKGADGMLPTEASPKDGMHFGQPYFDKWIDYLKTHTVGGAPAAAQAANSSSEAGSSSADGSSNGASEAGSSATSSVS